MFFFALILIIACVALITRKNETAHKIGKFCGYGAIALVAFEILLSFL